MDFSTLLSKLGDKDRQTLERQMLACETKLGVEPAEQWRRLACALMTLSSPMAKFCGSHAIQFFIPDGKYRKQVFALHALGDGALAVYAPNVLEEAARVGLLEKRRRAEADDLIHRLAQSDETLTIDALDGKTPNPDVFYKDMTGWNRKAICITLPPKASDAQLAAVEQLCALAAAQWTAA
jgi:hypothetical protein